MDRKGYNSGADTEALLCQRTSTFSMSASTKPDEKFCLQPVCCFEIFTLANENLRVGLALFFSEAYMIIKFFLKKDVLKLHVEAI